MPAFTDWLRRVLDSGESVQTDPPLQTPAEQPAVGELLHAAYRRHALSLAGDAPECDLAVADRAAVALAHACWRLTAGDDALAVSMGREPATPSAHLSADVCLRFLPNVYRRAVKRAPESPLVKDIVTIFRAWPLSGVLTDLSGGPTTPPTFDRFGLRLLYAERLVVLPRVGWVPPDADGREVLEQVFVERGLTYPASFDNGGRS
jgi:MoxR-vWA-beta-propeller ternary system domain bpX4